MSINQKKQAPEFSTLKTFQFIPFLQLTKTDMFEDESTFYYIRRVNTKRKQIVGFVNFVNEVFIFTTGTALSLLEMIELAQCVDLGKNELEALQKRTAETLRNAQQN